MKIKRTALIVTLLLVATLGWRFFGTNRSAGSTSGTGGNDLKATGSAGVPASHAVARQRDPLASLKAAYQTPIELYGKVVDQHGKPVQGATVLLLPFDNLGEDSRSQTTLVSDDNGCFSIKGLRGLAMGVQVTKKGYLTRSDLGFETPASSRRLEYGLDGTGGKRFKDPANPVIFTLTDPGPLEPLFYMEETRWKLPTDGTPRGIALDSKNGTGTHQIEFMLTSRVRERTSSFKAFDWMLEARIPGGGFVKNDSDYNFEAPATGYVETIKFDYPTTLPPENWRGLKHGRYFVRFADGTFARIRFCIDATSTGRPLSMTSWINLKPGSRNLASLEKDNCGIPED